jgi:hypothetical protein
LPALVVIAEGIVNPSYEYRALLACDIAGSAGRGEQRLQEIRSVLRTALSGAMRVAKLDEREFAYVDTGDGCQLVAPDGLLKARLLAPLLPELNSRIREHNRHAAPEVRMRVRVAVHAGEVRVDPGSVGVPGAFSGAPFEALARLLDAAPLRQAAGTGNSGTPVAAILSHHYHEDTVGHGNDGLEADAFSAVTVQVKEYRATAWLWYPGSPVGPSVEADGSAKSGARVGRKAAVPKPRGVEQSVHASGRGTVFAVNRGTQKIQGCKGS